MLKMRQIKKYIKDIVKYIYTDIFHKNTIKLYWYKNRHNFGDVINPLLLRAMTGKKVFWIEPELYHKRNYIAIGSILEKASSNTIVWGSGFISEQVHCHKKPLKVCAVRGPLSRAKLLEDGIECPPVFGDPALLLPKIYHPKIEKRFELGIIPHYVDRDNQWLQNVNKNQEVVILNIQNPDPYHFMDKLLSCKKIASSSLHGIIVADAYKIPSIWVEFSSKVVGGGFKFLDYFASVKRRDTEPLRMDEQTKISNIYKKFYDYEIDIDMEILINAFPLKFQERFMSKILPESCRNRRLSSTSPS